VSYSYDIIGHVSSTLRKSIGPAIFGAAIVTHARTISAALRQVYSLTRSHYGHQHWWPGETAFEVCVGAILTQNTNWGNVERAIGHLKAARVLEPHRLYAVPEAELARLIRPAGYYNVKAKRIRSFLRILIVPFHGSLEKLFAGETRAVRDRLLAISGIGPETADSMLLYAGGHASFVIDAYTKRIFVRHRWCSPDATYDDLQSLCACRLLDPPDGEVLDYWQDYHAQLVNVGKDFCRARQPRCESCPLKPLLERKPPNNLA
jgi:endonuclease-3 related protein